MDDQITERFVVPSDVYSVGFDGVTPTGTFTALGEELKRQNPLLLSKLVQQAQGEAYYRAGNIYPKCRMVDPAEVDQYRSDRAIGAPPAVKPALSKPAAAPSTTDELATLFGPKSDAAKANSLAKANPAEYQRLRALAVEDKLAAPTARDQRLAQRRS